jgi:hypothetical protein
MMFAVAVGEIGLQVAALVRSDHLIHYLPAFSHLFLATFVVAASWVGWSRSLTGGAKRDVAELFEWPFVVLLLDMCMVVTYFILVRTVNFAESEPRVDSATVVARWHVLIFILYLSWDFVTKMVMYRPPPGAGWWRSWHAECDGIRMLPTVVCLGLSLALWRLFKGTDYEHRLTADIALLCVVVLFRALKNLVSAHRPRKSDRGKPRRLLFRWSWTVACLLGLIWGTAMTVYAGQLPLPASVVQELRNTPPRPPSSGAAELR